jgi:hypothetical protein
VISTAGFGDALQQESQPQYFLPMSDTPVVQGSQTPIVGANLGDDLDQHQLQNPSLMANVNDWAFQGVDTAFFDSVMRGATDWDAGLRGNV